MSSLRLAHFVGRLTWVLVAQVSLCACGAAPTQPQPALNPETNSEEEDIGPIVADGSQVQDADGDNILDDDDLCPDQMETYNGLNDEDGCPDTSVCFVDTGGLPISPKVYFQPQSRLIQPESSPILDAVAATINGNPQLGRVQVEGHVAANERNPDALSQQRAQAVLDALFERGVPPDRLSLVTRGDSHPAINGASPEAHERNRRVEFHQEQVPGCPPRDELTYWQGERLALTQPIDFDIDSANIRARSFPVLDSIAARLCEGPNVHIQIQVHIDGPGILEDTALGEFGLTRQRASALVTALTQRGVRRERLHPEAYGRRCPLSDCEEARGRRAQRECYDANRRIEIYSVPEDYVGAEAEPGAICGRPSTARAD